MSLPAEIVQLAARQGGHVTRPQVIAAGLSPSAVGRRVTTGDLTVVTPGVYRVFPSNDHIDLIRGAVLALPDAVVSHQSAAHLLRFPLLPKLIPTVTVPSYTTHQFPGVTVRRCLDLKPQHLTKVDGLAVTNILRTSFDLAGILDFPTFDSITEALVIAGRLDVRHLDRITTELARRGKPGSCACRDFLAIRESSESRSTILERRGRDVLAKAQLPPPIPQFSIPWNPQRRFDDAYPDALLAIEWDSRAWHEQRAAMGSDRKRDRDAAIHGWFIARFTWQDVVEIPDEVANTVRTLLHERTAI